MNNANKNNMFAATAHPPTDDLVKYVNKQLEATAIRSIENHIADCEPCSDALDGLMSAKLNIAAIDKNLEQRIQTQLSNTKKTIPLYKRWYMATAAMLALVFVSGYLIINYVGKNNSVVDAIATEPATDQTTTATTSESSDGKPVAVENENIIVNKGVPAEQQKQAEVADISVPESAKQKALANENYEEKFKHPALEKREDIARTDHSATTEMVSESSDDTQEQPAVAEKEELFAKTKDMDSAKELGTKKAADEKVKAVEMLGKKSNNPAASTTTGGAANQLDNIVVVETKAARKKTSQIKSDANFDYSAFEQARTLYNNKEYAKAQPMFEALMVQNANNKNPYYYAGMCAYFQNNYKLADTYLTQTSADKRFEMYEMSLWYQSLSLIQLNKPAEAKKLLIKVVSLKQSKKDEAANLLKELK